VNRSKWAIVFKNCITKPDSSFFPTQIHNCKIAKPNKFASIQNLKTPNLCQIVSFAIHLI